METAYAMLVPLHYVVLRTLHLTCVVLQAPSFLSMAYFMLNTLS